MKSFFSQLRYSFGNEDWNTEQLALQIQPDDKVLCITASGDRPLNLLTMPCSSLVALDANPIQNHLLELKIAAMKEFDYPTYIKFLGGENTENRLDLLNSLLKKMDSTSASYWKKYSKMVQKGILYQGKTEKITTNVAKFIKWIHGDTIDRLFNHRDIEEQRLFIKNDWDPILIKRILKIVLNPFFARKLIINDPGLNGDLSPSAKPGDYFFERMMRSLNNYLAIENPLLSLVLNGGVHELAFAPYLTEKGTAQIKMQIDKIQIKTADVITHLESIGKPTYDCFSLSDVISYLNPEQFIRLLRAMLKCANPKARFCMRQFLSYHQIPEDLLQHFNRNSQLEEDLEVSDRCFVYRFMTGEIIN